MFQFSLKSNSLRAGADGQHNSTNADMTTVADSKIMNSLLTMFIAGDRTTEDLL